MKVWIVTFGVLFILVELYQWVKGFILPFPIYLLGGAFLAIASNSDKGIGSGFNPSIHAEETLSQTATLIEPIQVLAQESMTKPVLEGVEDRVQDQS